MITYLIVYFLTLLKILSNSLFMTQYLNNLVYIVIFNIYPMIKFGNMLIIIYYAVFLTKIGYHVIIKKTSKGSGRL